MKNLLSKDIIQLEFNRLPLELFENLLQDNDSYRPIHLFQINGAKGVGKSALLYYFKTEATCQNKTVTFMKDFEEIENLNSPATSSDFILIDKINDNEELEIISGLFSKSKIIFTSDENDIFDIPSLVVQANIKQPTLDEYSQIIKKIFERKEIVLKESTCAVFGYLAQKSQRGLHTIYKVYDKTDPHDSEENIKRRFEHNISFQSNRFRNNNFIHD